MKIKSLLFVLLLALCELAGPSYGQTLNQVVPLTMQNAATATAVGAFADVSGYSVAGVEVTIAGTSATVAFEGLVDTTWAALACAPVGGGPTTTQATASGLFRCVTAGLKMVRANITACSSCTVTAKAFATTAPVGQVDAVRSDQWNRIRCTVAVSTATTVQAVGGSCVAPGAALSIYVTDIDFGSSAASGVAADSFPTLKYGTGGTCGSGTTVFWQALTAANSTQTGNYSTPVKIPANNELCWIMTTAGSKTINILGFIAP